jgi:uncharacterized repeat protein (TIGR02543 family)
MRRFWAATALVLLATALALGVGNASAATPTIVLVEVIGNGEVAGTGVDCGAGHTDCYATYSDTTGTIDLTATAAATWSFDGWDASSTDCSTTTTNPCLVPKDGLEHRVQADFSTGASTPTRTLSISVPLDASSKGGEVTDKVTPPGVNVDCGSGAVGKCTWEVIDQSTLTVVETPDGGYFFNGWGGDCASSSTSKACTVQMTSDRNVSATFSSASATATLTVTVVGNGTVTGGGITCGSGAMCTANEPNGSSVTLTAQPASGYTFIGWGATGGATGDCTGTQDTCTVQMSGAHSVTATFATTFELKVSVSGSGNVSGGTGVGAINCGNGPSDCSGDEQQDKTVTLTAAAAFGSSFLGWSGACTGVTTSCTITMNTDKTVSASFRSTTFPLSVSVSGTGSVSGGGITCGAGASVCNADVTANSTVTLTATPGSGAAFTGWSGACSGALTSCTFSMTSAKSVSATFSTGVPTTPPPPPNTVPLSVSVSGKGSVTGGGISCGNGAGVCTANETVNSTVTLLATPAQGANFQGWGGACSGTQTTCSVSATAAVSVSATFTGGTAGLTLTIKVGGKGTVTAPAGKCTSGGSGKTCAQRYSAGTAVTLKAAAAKGARFLGWSGACAGKKLTCVVMLKASRTAVAGFSGAVTLKRGAVLQAVGSPVVKRAGSRFLVTLHFQTTLAGTARVQGLRAGRVLTALNFHVRAGADTVGPFPVAVPGFFTFLVTLVDRAGRSHTIKWQACLGSCGARAPASAGVFAVTREKPTIKRAGTAWLVTLHFRETQPSGAEVLVLRHGSVVADLNFAPDTGEVSLGPFVLAPGDYSIRVTATDAFGRIRHLSFSAVLAR